MTIHQYIIIGPAGAGQRISLWADSRAKAERRGAKLLSCRPDEVNSRYVVSFSGETGEVSEKVEFLKEND